MGDKYKYITRRMVSAKKRMGTRVLVHKDTHMSVGGYAWQKRKSTSHVNIPKELHVCGKTGHCSPSDVKCLSLTIQSADILGSYEKRSKKCPIISHRQSQ